MTNPIYDPYQILSKVYSEGSYLKQAISSCFIEEINRAKTVKICYGVLENDIYLTHCIKAFSTSTPKLPIRIILKISLYMLIFLEKQKYMVTDSAVSLCKKLGKGGASGFVNAFLRSFDKDKLPQIKNKIQALSVKYSYPEFAVKSILEEYTAMGEDIMSAQTEGVSVRFTSKENAQPYLDREYLKTPFDDVYLFKNFKRDEGFDEGKYTFQSLGSVAICDVVQPCDSLLDACSAPGGKSVLLANKCKSVTSTELHEHRVELIKSYAERMGITNIIPMQADSTILNVDFVDNFDCVLCDVPCSGLGVVQENPDIKFFRKQEDIPSLNITQLAILKNCSNYVKKGGSLYYSTCSILNSENDIIVGKFLKENSQFEVEQLKSPLRHISKKYGIQFLPNISMGAGFYVCKLVKKL